MARKPKVTHKRLMKAIEGSGGVITNIAFKLSVDWHTAKKAIENDSEAKEFYEGEGNKVTDLAQNIIIEALNDHDLGTAKWWLERKGAALGYNPTIKIDETKNVSVTHEYIDDLEPDNEESKTQS